MVKEMDKRIDGGACLKLIGVYGWEGRGRVEMELVSKSPHGPDESRDSGGRG